MANTIHKTCTHCGKSLPTTEFHKNKNNKDGLLTRCKTCQNQKTAEYREGDGKDYWYSPNGNGWFQKAENMKKFNDYLLQKYKAKGNCKIYALIAPDGMTYVGLTKHENIKKRFWNHRTYYSSWKRGLKISALPLLFESFNKWGVENHKLILLESLDTDDKKEGLRKESEWIKKFKNAKISLNVQD